MLPARRRVAILDAPSLSLRSGPGEVWDYLGRPEILAGQLTRVGVERRQYITAPLPEVVAESAPVVPVDEEPAAEGPEESTEAPLTSETAERGEAAEADQSVEEAAEQSTAASEGPVGEHASVDAGATAQAAIATGANVPAEAEAPSAPVSEPVENAPEAAAEPVPASKPTPEAMVGAVTEQAEAGESASAEAEILTPVSAPEAEDAAVARQARHMAATAHTPAEAAETPEAPEALGQPVAPAETEPVAAPTGGDPPRPALPRGSGPRWTVR